MAQLYVIESIRTLIGEPHKLAGQCVGQRVELLRCEIGAPLLVCLRDERNKILRTSTVTNVFPVDVHVVITTQNSVYTFRKAVA